MILLVTKLLMNLNIMALDVNMFQEFNDADTSLAFCCVKKMMVTESFSFYRKPGADLMLKASEVRRDLIDQCKIFHLDQCL